MIGVEDIDLGYKDIIKRVMNFGDHEIDTGFMNGKIHKASGELAANVAHWNERGTQGNGMGAGGAIPSRPFMAQSMDMYRGKMEKEASDQLGKVIDGATSPLVAGRILGEEMKKNIRKRIVELKRPANAPSTIKHKKSDNPLVETGELQELIDIKVRKVR